MVSKKTGVPVSTRALLQRINRKLAEGDEQLKTARSDRARLELGDYYVIDVNRNVVRGKNVDPETLGRELGVLKGWETVVD